MKYHQLFAPALARSNLLAVCNALYASSMLLPLIIQRRCSRKENQKIDIHSYAGFYMHARSLACVCIILCTIKICVFVFVYVLHRV